MRDINQNAEVNTQESHDQRSQTTMGIDPAIGEDKTTMLMFKIDKQNKVLLYNIMVTRNHNVFSDTLLTLIWEETKRMQEKEAERIQEKVKRDAIKIESIGGCHDIA